CVAMPVLVGLVDLTNLVRDAAPGAAPGDWIEHARQLSSTIGYNYNGYLPKFAKHLDGTRVEKAKVMLGFDEPHHDLLEQAIAITIYGGDGPGPSIDEIEKELAQ